MGMRVRFHSSKDKSALLSRFDFENSQHPNKHFFPNCESQIKRLGAFFSELDMANEVANYYRRVACYLGGTADNTSVFQ
jgi:hypothetical protein